MKAVWRMREEEEDVRNMSLEPARSDKNSPGARG